MSAVDVLHDFELGVWKSVFKHLIRMLYACGNEKVQMLNERSDPVILLWIYTTNISLQISFDFCFWEIYYSKIR
jgi:hypothetical protein